MGAGAIGSLWADRLHRQGEAITLVLRTPEQLNAFNCSEKSLRIETLDDKLKTFHCEALLAKDIADSITHLLITTKAFDALDAIKSVEHQLASDAVIVVMINGYGVQGKIQASFPNHRILFASTTDGAFNKAPFHTIHAANGSTLIGSIKDNSESNYSPLPGAEWTHDIDAILWRKVAINCCINPVTALSKCTNGEIFSTDERSELTITLAKEIEQLELKMGIERQIPLIEEVRSIAELTSQNRSSMLQDVSNGRRTEVEHINGAIVDLAREFGVQAPLNLEMLQRIQNITFNDH
jgi:2-dehydropantoate 2-reductase